MPAKVPNSILSKKPAKLPPAQIDQGQSWDSLFELPLVKREYLPDIVLGEVTKRYPRAIPTDVPVFWTIVGSVERNGSSALLCLASVPFNRHGSSVPALHVACRAALPKTKGSRQWLALILAGDFCRGVSVNFDSVTLVNLKINDLPQWLAENASEGENFLFNPEARDIPQAAIEQACPKIIITNGAIPLTDGLAAPGSWPAKPPVKRLGFIAPVLLLVAFLGIGIGKISMDQDQLINQQKTQILALQKSLGSYQHISEEIKALEKELAGVPLPLTIGAYEIIGEVAKAFESGDKTISIHYDGKNRTFAMVCLSKNPIKLLKRISELEILESVTSSGIVAWQQDPSYQKFQWSGVLRK